MGEAVETLRRLGACGDEGDAIPWVASRAPRAGLGPAAARLWRECPRGDWLLWLAARAGVDRRLVVLATCDCARLALKYVPAGEERPLRAIETAERWARGEDVVTLADVRSAYAAAYAAADAAARAETLGRCADLVRARIPWAAVRRALRG